MDDIYVYTVNLPRNVDEVVTPCLGGYTIYLSARLDERHRLKAYRHALHHIARGDFEKDNVQVIEKEVRKCGIRKRKAGSISISSGTR